MQSAPSGRGADGGDPIVEEVYNDDSEVQQDEKEPDVVVPLETKMERALITTALLLSKKECGAWALSMGWSDAATELPDLIESENAAAMCLAAEVLQSAAVNEAARGMVTGIVSSGCMETLMSSPDRDIRSGAASAVAKLGLSDRTKDEGELMGLLQAACELLDDQDSTSTATPNKSAKKDTTKEFNQFSSFATSSVE